jgi:hypothetical protein
MSHTDYNFSTSYTESRLFPVAYLHKAENRFNRRRAYDDQLLKTSADFHDACAKTSDMGTATGSAPASGEPVEIAGTDELGANSNDPMLTKAREIAAAVP